jgi:hypothetical protein
MTNGLGVRISLIVDTPDEPAAMAIAQALVARSGLEAAGWRWKPYPKLGPHSRVDFELFLPPGLEGQAVIDAIESICALLVDSQALQDGYLNSFFNDDGSFVYNRIFDDRTSNFVTPQILWADVEVETNEGAQRQLRQLSGLEPL